MTITCFVARTVFPSHTNCAWTSTALKRKSENIEVVDEFQSFLKSCNDLLVGYKQTRSVAVQNTKEIDWYYDQALMAFKQTISNKRTQDLGKISKAADVCDKIINQLNDTIDNIEQSRERRNTTELFIRLISIKSHTVLIGENLRRINQDNSFERYFFQPMCTTLCFGQTLSVSTYTSIISHDDTECNQLLFCPGDNLICISQTKISCINTLTKMKNGINFPMSPCLAQYVGNELIVMQMEPPSTPSFGNLRGSDESDVELQENNLINDSSEDEIAASDTDVGTRTTSSGSLFGAKSPITTSSSKPLTGFSFGATNPTLSTGKLIRATCTTPNMGFSFGATSTTPSTVGLFGATRTAPSAKPIQFPVQAITSLKLKYVYVKKSYTTLTHNGTDLIAVHLDPLGIDELDAKGHTKCSTVVSNFDALTFNGTQFIKHPTCAVYDVTDDTIYIADSKMDSVFKVTRFGECRCVVRSERLASPSGIALCRDGTLMVCCSKDKCVLKVTKDGHIYSFIGPLQFEPLALAYDETNGLLYVGGKCNEIYVYTA